MLTEAVYLFAPFLFGFIPFLGERCIYYEWTLEVFAAGLLIFGLCRRPSLFLPALGGAILTLYFSTVAGICLLYAALCIRLVSSALSDRSAPRFKLGAGLFGLLLFALSTLPIIPETTSTLLYALAPFLCTMAVLNSKPWLWCSIGLISLMVLFLLPNQEFRRPDTVQASFQKTLADLFDIQESHAVFPSPIQLEKLLGQSGPKRVLIPLADSPLQDAGSQVGFSHSWKYLYKRWRKVFPVFYLYKFQDTYWITGFRDLNDWRLAILNTIEKIQENQDSNAAFALQSQVLGYMDFVNQPDLVKSSQSWILSKCKNNFSPPLYWYFSRFQKNRLEVEIQTLVPLHPLFSKEAQASAIRQLIENQELPVARSLLYRFQKVHIDSSEYKELLTLFSLESGDFHAAVASARGAVAADSRQKPLLFKALSEVENNYHGHPPFNYAELINLAKEIYEDSQRRDPYWLLESVRLQEKKIGSMVLSDRKNPWKQNCGNCKPITP
jgi:hypothetical protein